VAVKPTCQRPNCGEPAEYSVGDKAPYALLCDVHAKAAQRRLKLRIEKLES